MSRFNQATVEKSKTTNLAGGTAHVQNAKMEYASILLTSFMNDQHYRSTQCTLDRLAELKKQIHDPKFIAQAAIYARNEFGMRSITHKVAASLARDLSGKPYASSFYNKIVRRVDDMTEILAAYMAEDKANKLPNSIRKGFAKAFDRFDEYQLAKYQAKDKEISLVDVINIVHPKPTEKNAEALRKIINDELKQTETWNAGLSQAGTASSPEDKAAAKMKVWDDFVAKGEKVEYFALLRNLNNIFEQGSLNARSKALELLQNKNLIQKSKVLPFRFLTAAKAVASSPAWRNIIGALNIAMEHSLSNIPELSGNTLIAIDCSGSMTSKLSGKSDLSIIEIAALFGAALYKKTNSEVVLFENRASYARLNPADSLDTLAGKIVSAAHGGGTDFGTIFDVIGNRAYDRIIVLSDMQSWGHSYGWSNSRSIKESFSEYRKKANVDPLFYSLDLAGYGTLLLPENNVFALAGYSEKIFDLFSLLEQDRNALVHTIESIEL
jgi:hypothetical protein